MSKKTKKEKLKKEKKLNGELFIDAYFIPRAKSVRCWTRNLTGICKFSFVFQIKELLIFNKCDPTLFGEKIHYQSTEKRCVDWTTCRTGGTSSLCVGRITSWWEEEGMTSSWIRPHSHERTRENVGVIRKHKIGEDANHIRTTLAFKWITWKKKRIDY